MLMCLLEMSRLKVAIAGVLPVKGRPLVLKGEGQGSGEPQEVMGWSGAAHYYKHPFSCWGQHREVYRRDGKSGMVGSCFEEEGVQHEKHVGKY